MKVRDQPGVFIPFRSPRSGLPSIRTGRATLRAPGGPPARCAWPRLQAG